MSYEMKLRHFLEGLEMEDIDDLMRKTPVELKLVGSVMANRIKELKIPGCTCRNTAVSGMRSYCGTCGRRLGRGEIRYTRYGAPLPA